MADEPKATQDSPEKVTPEKEQDTSQLETLKTQVEELAQKRASDILAQKGREKDKAYESTITQLKAQLTQLQDKQDELEAGKGDDDNVKKVLDDKKRMRQLEAQIAEKEQKLKDIEAERDAERTERQKLEAKDKIYEAASGLPVSIEDLEAKLEELGIKDPAKFRKVAEMMARKGEEPGRPDSGKGGGAGPKTTDQMLKERYPSMYPP